MRDGHQPLVLADVDDPDLDDAEGVRRPQRVAVARTGPTRPADRYWIDVDAVATGRPTAWKRQRRAGDVDDHRDEPAVHRSRRAAQVVGDVELDGGLAVDLDAVDAPSWSKKAHPSAGCSITPEPYRRGLLAARRGRRPVRSERDPSRGVRCGWAHGRDGLRGGARRRRTASSSRRSTRSTRGRAGRRHGPRRSRPTPTALVEAGAEVSVDFTVVAAARENLRWCAAHDVHAVVGTTGFTEDDLDEIDELFGDSAANAFIAPNFAIGAVLMMRFAEQAAPWFETAEIIELHHDQKIDAPSGTAMRDRRSGWPRRRSSGRPTRPRPSWSKARAAGWSTVRSGCTRCGCAGWWRTRRCILGTTGETLTIRHDSYDRSSFMPGVLLAVRKVAGLPSLTVGLDALLDA